MSTAHPRLAAAALALCLPASIMAAPRDAEPSATAPAAKSIPATDHYPGFDLTDPYRNLEDLKDPDTQAWMKARAAHARRVLDAIPERAALRAALDAADAMRAWEVSDIQRSTADRTFFLRREANAPIARLHVRDGDSGTGRLLFDPSDFDSEAKTHAVSWYAPSPSGRRVAVGIAPNGSEQADFYVLDVASGERLDGPVPRSWFGRIEWLDDERMLVHRFNEAAPDTPAAEAWLDSQAWLHRVGTPIEQDVHVFGTALRHPPEGLPPQDQAYVVLRSTEPYAVGFGGGPRPHYSAWTLPAADLGKPDARWRPLFLGDAKNQSTGADIRDGRLYTISALSANGEIVRYDLATGRRHVVRAAGDRPIENLGVARDGLYFRERDGVYTTLKRIGFDGTGEIAIRFPRKGNPSPAGDGPYTHPDLDGALVSLDSWTEPDTGFLVTADGSTVALGLSAPVTGIDLSQVHARDMAATSHDGTRVPMTLLHYGTLRPPDQQPVLLMGYGSYGMSIDPFFSRSLTALSRQGVATAICHVRGGGEYGSAWHEAGRLANKPNTWKDFIACAEALVAEGVTQPGRLVGWGGSAGGITISNAVDERPELFAGAINDVGASDMPRMLTTSQNGPNHYDEFGDIRTAEGAAIARAMSGYHKITPGKPYPAWLVIHGINDPRVDVWQSNKFTARMDAASGQPVIYRLDYASGHGVGSTADAQKDEFADVGAFVLDVTHTHAAVAPTM